MSGWFVGSTMGFVTGGAGYNAAWVFGPLGAFVGWLVSSKMEQGSTAVKNNDPTEHDEHGNEQEAVGPSAELGDRAIKFFQDVLWSVLVLLATVWNFHIDLLEKVGFLPTFVRQPLLFPGMCIAVSLVFPPFFILYLLAWVAASTFNISEETNYRATIK